MVIRGQKINFFVYILFLIGALNYLCIKEVLAQKPSDSTTEEKITLNNTTKQNPNNKQTKLSGSWRMALAGGYVTDEINKQNATGFSASAKLKYSLLQSLNLFVEPVVSFNTGQAQSIYGELRPKNSIYAKEAILHFVPLKYLEITSGIISQKRINNQLLVKSIGFPSIEGTIHLLKFNRFKSSFKLMEAVPSSYTLNSNAGKLEDTPRFHVQTLEFILGEEDKLNGLIFLSHFSFDNLPSKVAETSASLGNTVSDGQHFDYEFEGWSSGLNTLIPIFNPLKIEFKAGYLKNLKAPKGMNEGRSASFGIHYQLPFDVDLNPLFKQFKNDPDASPAYYNSTEYANSNRQGYIYGMNIIFNKYNFIISGKYVDAQLIYKTPFQAHRRSIILKLETFDVRF